MLRGSHLRRGPPCSAQPRFRRGADVTRLLCGGHHFRGPCSSAAHRRLDADATRLLRGSHLRRGPCWSAQPRFRRGADVTRLLCGGHHRHGPCSAQPRPHLGAGATRLLRGGLRRRHCPCCSSAAHLHLGADATRLLCGVLNERARGRVIGAHRWRRCGVAVQGAKKHNGGSGTGGYRGRRPVPASARQYAEGEEPKPVAPLFSV